MTAERATTRWGLRARSPAGGSLEIPARSRVGRGPMALGAGELSAVSGADSAISSGPIRGRSGSGAPDSHPRAAPSESGVSGESECRRLATVAVGQNQPQGGETRLPLADIQAVRYHADTGQWMKRMSKFTPL